MSKANLNNWRRGRKCLLKNTVDFVFLTRNKNAFTGEHLDRLEIIFDETCKQMKCQLLQFNGSVGHVYLSILVHSSISVSRLVAKLKGKSAYFITREFPSELKDKTIKNRFWSSSYAAISGENTSTLIAKFITEDT